MSNEYMAAIVYVISAFDQKSQVMNEHLEKKIWSLFYSAGTKNPKLRITSELTPPFSKKIGTY